MSKRAKRMRPSTPWPLDRGRLGTAATRGGALSVAPAKRLPEFRDQTKQSGDLLDTLIDRYSPDVVAVTYGFDPPVEPPVQAVTIRFSGRRLNVSSQRPNHGDVFVHDETIRGVVGGSGPIAVTAKIRDVNPGRWTVSARITSCQADESTSAGGLAKPSLVVPLYPARWSWLRWRLSTGTEQNVATRRAAFATPPAVVLGSWPACVALGIALALVSQAAVMSTRHLQLGNALLVSAVALLTGALAAKLWYIFLHRRDGQQGGWSIQGLVAAVAIVMPVMLIRLGVPVGAFLDASAPGVMLGLGVGRLGCFFTGCCAGRATASRWALWSSNRVIGARRVPTQLLEAALALLIGLVVLGLILGGGPRQGALFVAAVAAYTLARQGLLMLREERRQSRYWPRLVAAAAGFALAVDLAYLLTISSGA